MGIKHKEKKPKVIKIAVGQPLFRQGLQYLKLADAFLDNGTVVQKVYFAKRALRQNSGKFVNVSSLANLWEKRIV
ncbi:hypothetical protein ACLKA7_007890 [Drosophila subpalustris]